MITLFLKDNKIRSGHLLPNMSWKNILKLSLPTIANGVGTGFISPIFSIWFHLRFGISSGEIDLIFGLSNLFVILVMLVLPRVLSSDSELKSIIWTRIISSAAWIALAPILSIVSALYVFRQGRQMGAVPVRQSFAMGIVVPS